MIAEGALDGRSLQLVAQRSGRAVCVDIADLLRGDASISHSIPHYAESPRPVLGWLGNVVGVGAHAVTDHLSDDFRSALLGELKLFQDQDARAFADRSEEHTSELQS